MIIKARAVKKPRGFVCCEECGKEITGPHIYLYGMAFRGDKPWGLREHVFCASNVDQDKKYRAAYDKALLFSIGQKDSL